MINKKIFILAISLMLAGCAKPPTQVSTNLNISSEKELLCHVDSNLFSKPYIKKSSGKSYQTLPDETSVTFIMNGSALESIQINGENRFRRCSSKMQQIEDRKLIENIFGAVDHLNTQDLERFYDAWFAICHTVDEGWHFLKKGNLGYVGYAGPGDLPVSVVGMKCN